MAEYRGYIKWLLFLSSYVPLFFILVFKHWSIQYTVRGGEIPLVGAIPTMRVPYISVVWTILIIVSLLGLYVAINVRTSREPKEKDIDSPKSRNELITNYILVYIFPFVVLEYTNFVDWLAFIVFFFVIGVVQVRANQLFVNPILAICQYDVYEAEIDGEPVLLLTRKDRTEIREPVNTVELSDNVHLTV
jgi:hypothetical protein